MKKILFLIIVIVVLGIGWYLISPAFRTVEVNDESPLVKDSFDTMDVETRQDFEQQTRAMADDVKQMDDNMPDAPGIVSQGEFKPRAHEVEGKALLIETGDEKILRFEDFDTINGPDLRIYLSTDLGTDDFVELGKIKATKGNVNYEISSDIDTDKYNKVLVWCKPFGVLFSYAELK